MWCYARDVDEFREQAGAVIEAYNKATAAGALQSTAERAAAAVAYKIDAGYRNFVKDDKKWKLERRAAAAKLEALAMKARRLVKKARKLVSCGTVCEHMLPKRAMDYILNIDLMLPPVYFDFVWRLLGNAKLTDSSIRGDPLLNEAVHA